MTFLIHVLSFLILIAFVITLFLFIIFALDSLIKRHDLPTSRQATAALAEMIRKYKPNAAILCDLGCARGALSLRLKKSFPQIDIYGVDNNTVRIFFARMKSKILRRKVNFQKKDIFKTDLRDVDVVYTYLWYDLMPTLEKKLHKELKRGAIVITNTSHFQDWQPVEEVIIYPKISQTPDFETLFIYIKK